MRRLSRLVAAAPAVGDALDNGTLGIGQAHLIARAHANPRCAEQLLDQVPQLLQHAANESAARFERIMLDWIELVDQDGGFDARQRAHDDRSMSLGDSEHTFMLRVFGDAIDGEELRQGFKRYLDAEWKAEWAECVAQHGDDACPARMARTAAQRRYDAFMRMVRDAISVISGQVAPEALVNLMIDIATFQRIVDHLFGATAGDDVPTDPLTGQPLPHDEHPDATDDSEKAHDTSHRPAETLAGLFGGVGPLARPDDLRRWCSHTTDGRFIPPIDIVLEAFRGQIRLVITDERGVVLHMGHRKRLFTGALRQAVMLAANRCTHPGCDVASGDSQADHLTPHSHGGVTAITNGGPGCGTHNRWRYVNRAITTLDADGYWRTYRADGTEIA